MKKGLLVTTLLAASTLLLASCEKTVSFDEAKKHVNDNYTSTEEKLCDAKAVTKVTKSDGFFSTFFEVGEQTEEATLKMGVIQAGALDQFGDKATYKVDGKKLAVEVSIDVKVYLESLGAKIGADDEVGGSVFSKVNFDDDGYCVSELQKIENLHFKSTSSLGLTIEGNLSMESTVTYTARPAN